MASVRRLINADGSSSMGWWGADFERTTGQAIVTRQVVGLMERYGVRTFSYRGTGMHSMVSALWSAIRLAWAVLRGHVKTLYLVCSRSNAGFVRDIPAYLVLFFGVRVLVHTHGSDIVDLCRRPAIGLLAKALLSRCEVIVPSSHLIEPLHGQGITNLHLCENFAQNTDGSKNSGAQIERRRDFHPFKVLWNSNLMASKGFFAVAQAVGALSGQGKNIQLIALGEPLGDEVMSLAACKDALSGIKNQEWINLKGSVNRKTALGLLHEADLICLPSQYSSECQPLALIEAMCAGRMILIADTPALQATVGDYPCTVVKRPNSHEVQLALQTIIDNPMDQNTLFNASRKAEDRFSKKRFESEISMLLGITSTSA